MRKNDAIPKTNSSKSLKLKKYIPNYIGLLPFFGLLITFIIVPMVYGIVMSFTNWSVSAMLEVEFIGFENYIYILSGEGTGSERFLKSLANLVVYVPITITIGLTLSLILALIVNNLQNKLYKFFRGSYFVPTVLPLFLCVGIWQWLLNADTGLVAGSLAKIGIGDGVNWANTAGYAIAMVIIIDVWNAAGFNFIIFSTGMQDISPDLYEAAEIDGASTFRKMVHITIPMLEPIIFFVITYSFISAIQVYDIPWILSATADINNAGGPGQIMLFPVMEMVRNVYTGSANGLGRATAEGTVLMAIIMLVTLIQFKLRKKKV